MSFVVGQFFVRCHTKLIQRTKIDVLYSYIEKARTNEKNTEKRKSFLHLNLIEYIHQNSTNDIIIALHIINEIWTPNLHLFYQNFLQWSRLEGVKW